MHACLVQQDKDTDAKVSMEASSASLGATEVKKKKKRGKSSSLRRYLKKNANIIDAKKEAVKRRLEKERKQKEKERKKESEAGKHFRTRDQETVLDN